MRHLTGYVVGFPVYEQSRHQRRGYEVQVTQQIISVIGKKGASLEVDTDIIVRLAGNPMPIKSEDDFSRVADCFTESILNHHPLEVTTDKWKYRLYSIRENSITWRM